MKLYYTRGACSLAVRILIHELNLEATYVAVNLATKKTENDEDFLKINPKGYVPTLELDNKELLTENSIIHQYLAETNNATNILPSMGNMQHYRVLEALNFVSSELHKGCAPFFNPEITDELKEKVFKPALIKKLTLANELVGRKNFMTGSDYSLPDGYLFVILTWLKKIKIDLADFPNLKKFFHNMLQRPGVQKSLEEEKMKIHE